MSRLLWIALACSFAFAVVAGPAVAQAAKAKADKCTVHPSDIRRQCALELGGMCDPSTGTVTLDGPSGGSILGVQRFEECVARKRRQAQR